MLWIVITLLCAAAVGFRIYTLSGRPQLWWLAFTGTLVLIVAGAGFRFYETTIDASFGSPNLAYLMSNLSFTLAAGTVQVYVHNLRREAPSPRWMLLHFVTSGAVAAVVIAGWMLAPIHDVTYQTDQLMPFHVEALAYDGLFHVYLGAVLANVAVCAATLVRSTPRDDPGRRYGLIAIASSSALDVVAHVVYLAEMALEPTIGRSALLLSQIADLLTVVAMLGIVIGTVTFQVVPALVAHRHAQQLITDLEPLWLRVLELEPNVALPDSRHSPTLRVERMIIEIHDGLRRLTVPPHAPKADGPYQAAARALVTRERDGVPMSHALPTLTSRQDEEAGLVELAHAYALARKEFIGAS